MSADDEASLAFNEFRDWLRANPQHRYGMAISSVRVRTLTWRGRRLMRKLMAEAERREVMVIADPELDNRGFTHVGIAGTTIRVLELQEWANAHLPHKN